LTILRGSREIHGHQLKSGTHLAIVHVVFIDVVGYSRLLINEQREAVHELIQIVRQTSQFRKSDADGELICIPSGDGMALVFFKAPYDQRNAHWKSAGH
jgi:hypothetical protein